MQWRAQFDAPPDDLAFFQRDDRRHDFNLRFRPRPHTDQFLEHPVVFWPAIRIAGAVLRHRADVNRAGADGLRPAHCHGTKMRIPKRHIRYRNCAPLRTAGAQVIFWNGDALVRECGPANRAKVAELYDKPFAHVVEICDVIERALFAPLRELAVTAVQQGDVRSAMTLARHRRAHTRIHPPAQQHHRFSLVRPYHGSWPLPLCSVSLTSFTSFTSFASLSSNSLALRIPNKFVQLH